jgi:hypothetical protein
VVSRGRLEDRAPTVKLKLRDASDSSLDPAFDALKLEALML